MAPQRSTIVTGCRRFVGTGPGPRRFFRNRGQEGAISEGIEGIDPADPSAEPTPYEGGSRAGRFRRIGADGGEADIVRSLAVETPVAIEVGGVGYAVMMASPVDLEDFAVGFCLSERLVDRADQVSWCEPHVGERGVLLRIGVAAAVRDRIGERVRHRTSDSSCGLCGIKSLEQAMRPLPPVPASRPGSAAVFAALGALRGHQALGRETGAAHAAAACGADGAVRLVREDVGRHNALDKLIGAMARQGMGWEGGFSLVTSRLSYELVEKAALSGCGAIVAISAPTSLAIERAAAAGIHVIALARADALLAALA